MLIGLGTVINVLAIIAGSVVGVLAGSRLNVKTRELITDVLGLITILAAASAVIPMFTVEYSQSLPKGWTLLSILGSLLIGGIVGSALKIELRLEKLGENLRKKSQRWWKITDPMQSQVPEARPGEWWHVIPENFHVD